jgi:hypothetical protein
MNTTITLQEYLDKGKKFVIPDYQRGYVWGKNRDGEKNSVENLLDDLVLRYSASTGVFLQGFTVTEKPNEIVIIDGQQRTTCLYLLLTWLGYANPIEIQYEIRKASNDYLKSLDISKIEENIKEEFQDIFFFKKTLRIISSKLDGIDKEKFLSFLLSKVKFLYINVEEDKATRIFTMMNGSKAQMKQEEIIKAEILRIASLNTSDVINFQQEWEHNLLRSRYAREWDKWLHWWNEKDVQTLFRCHNIMGLLISSYLQQKKSNLLTFENFKAKCLPQESSYEAKQTFDGLRRIQKRFEDAYNEPSVHNMIGGILRIHSVEDQRKFIFHYFVEDYRENLEDYYKLVFLGLTHDEIIGKKKKEFAVKYDLAHAAINNDFIYLDDDKKEQAFRLLLRLNIDQDIQQNRLFNFDIWDERSLEHIQPKSKVGHDVDGVWYDGNDVAKNKDEFTMLRTDIQTTIDSQIFNTSEHSIGNLVLLYKNENSQFNSSDFFEKKELFFNPNKNERFRSRHLLHTICVFAEKQEWDGESIAINKINTVNKFEAYYASLRTKFDYEKQD